MRKFKKTLSVALAAIMAVSSAAVSSTAFAAETNDGSTVQKAAAFTNQTVMNTADTEKTVWYLFKPAKTADYTFSVACSKETGATAQVQVGVYDGVRYDWAKDKDGNYMMQFDANHKDAEGHADPTDIQNKVFDSSTFVKIVKTANEGDVVVNYDAGANATHYNLNGMGTETFVKAYTYLVKLVIPAKSYATISAVENTGYSYQYDVKREYVALYDKDGKIKTRAQWYTTGVGAEITGYHGASINLTMPKTVGGYDVTSVDLSNMSESKRIRIVGMTIPSTVTAIYGCDYMHSLKKVNMPADLTYVADHAFEEDMALKNRVDFGKKVAYIGAWSFDGTNIAGATVPNDDAVIGERAFGYTHGMNTTTQYKKYDDTIDKEINGFFVVANADSTGATYAKKEGFALYNAADCAAGKHQYALTKTVAATIWAAGSKTYTCKVCDATKVEVLKKKVLKASVKGGKSKFTVKASAMAGQTGYQIKFTKNGKSKSVKVKNARALNTTVKGLKAGKYKVKVRAYKKTSNGTKYSSYSAAKTVKVK